MHAGIATRFLDGPITSTKNAVEGAIISTMDTLQQALDSVQENVDKWVNSAEKWVDEKQKNVHDNLKDLSDKVSLFFKSS